MAKLGFEPWHFRPTEWAYHHFTLLLLQMFAFQGLDKLVQGRNLDVITSGSSDAGNNGHWDRFVLFCFVFSFAKYWLSVSCAMSIGDAKVSKIDEHPA